MAPSRDWTPAPRQPAAALPEWTRRPAGRRWPARLLAISLTLGMLVSLILAFASILHSERRSAQNERLALAAKEQQVLGQQLVAAVGAALRGDSDAFARLTTLTTRFRPLEDALTRDDRVVDITPSPPEQRRRREAAAAVWSDMRTLTRQLVDAEEQLMRFRELALAVRADLAGLSASSGRVAEMLAEVGAPGSAVLDAAMQVARVKEMIAALEGVLRGGSDASQGIELGTASADEFEVVLSAVRPLPRQQDLGQADLISAMLDETWGLYSAMRADADGLVELLPEVGPAISVPPQISKANRRLEKALDAVIMGLEREPGDVSVVGLRVGLPTALVFSGLALACLGLLGLQQLISSRRRARESQQQNQANQEAIARLLHEMGDLADGDLTVSATVTSDVTGAIAESINYAVDALRELVRTINVTSDKVSDSAQVTRSVAQRLAQGSEEQTRQIEQATGAISTMTSAIDEIAKNAAESATVASRSMTVAGHGAQAVRDTISRMHEIRGRIQETSRRIKRLGESSQEIGDIVELIDDIADQTNILALNAAMQAAMAGEAGRGFAVVADEVQRLAERSGSATKQIDAIVRAIRNDTVEAVRSMEASMAGVAGGADVAENAGKALREIEDVSTYIADLTRRIADSAGNESREAAKVNETVKGILRITQENARGTRSTAESVDALAQLAEELQRSVAGFKLP